MVVFRRLIKTWLPHSYALYLHSPSVSFDFSLHYTHSYTRDVPKFFQTQPRSCITSPAHSPLTVYMAGISTAHVTEYLPEAHKLAC